VKPGDTVGKIAKELGTTVRALRAENQLKNDMIHPGQKLRITSERPAPKPGRNEV
jgi:LysM repeat protein